MIGIAIVVALLTTALYLWWNRRLSPESVCAGVLALILAAQVEHAVFTLASAEKNPTYWTLFPLIVVVMPVLEEAARFTALSLVSRERTLFTRLVSVSLGVSITEVIYKLRYYADPDLGSLNGVVMIACSRFSSGLLHLLVALVVARRIEKVALWASLSLAVVVHAFYNFAVDAVFVSLRARGLDAELILSPIVIAALLTLVVSLIALGRNPEQAARESAA